MGRRKSEDEATHGDNTKGLSPCATRGNMAVKKTN
jgi:hypothetical protein